MVNKIKDNERGATYRKAVMPHRFCAVLMAVAIGSVAASAVAGPISGTPAGQSRLTPTSTPGIFTQSISGNGADRTYAPPDAASTSTIDFNSPDIAVENGSFVEGSGDKTLSGASSGAGTGNGQGTATVALDLAFTRGIGMFTDDTGEVLANERLMLTGPQSVSDSGSYSGAITIIAEPGSAALLATAGALVAGLAVRRRSLRDARWRPALDPMNKKRAFFISMRQFGGRP
jgi:hypothetical protein